MVTGIGDLSQWMALHVDAYSAKVRVALVPGSLNVVLDRAWRVPGDALRLEPPEYPVGMSIVPCRLGGIPAFILRTDDNEAGRGDHPPNVLEIAAAVHLRQALGLVDGDKVQIEVLG